MQAQKGTRNRGGWTKRTLDFLDQVKEQLEVLTDYWPLTLRQIYYRLVAALIISNSLKEYQKLSRVLTKGRLDGLVPWEAVEDRARSTLESSGWNDAAKFVETELEGFLKWYRRDLLLGQPRALEIWVEKDALSRICHDVAFGYCVPVIVARGFSSVSYLNDCRQRVLQNKSKGQPTKILYFGDLDPSGWAMLPAMMETLRIEMGLGDLVDAERCALTPEQVMQFNLPRSIDAMKESDSRTPKFKAMLRSTGYPDDLAVELDALPPAALEDLVRRSIESNLDMRLLKKDQRRQVDEQAQLSDLRTRVRRYVRRVA